MKASLVPENLRNPAGDPPYSLACQCIGGTTVLFSGVIKPDDYDFFALEVTAVMDEVFARVRKAGFEADDIIHVRLAVVGECTPKQTVEMNYAYCEAFKSERVGTSPESVFPCREAFFITDLMAKANFEATVTVWVP